MSKNINNETIAKALEDPNFSFIESFADAADVQKLGKELAKLMFQSRKQRDQLTIREREKVVLQTKYDKKKRESYMKHSNAPNEKTKMILVEIDTEKEKYEIEIIEQKIKEINRQLAAIKIEVDIIKSLTYNLRTEMGSF